VIEPSNRYQASVVFLGRRSFRMETGSMPVAEEIAIPKRASEIPTERIFRPKSVIDFQSLVPMSVPESRQRTSVSKVALIGLGAMAVALGMLMTSSAARPLVRGGVDHKPEVAAVQPPAAPVPLVEPIVVAAAPLELDFPPLAAAVSPPARAPRVRAVRAVRAKRADAVEGEAPESAAPESAPAPAKKWVDPFAD